MAAGRDGRVSESFPVECRMHKSIASVAVVAIVFGGYWFITSENAPVVGGSESQTANAQYPFGDERQGAGDSASTTPQGTMGTTSTNEKIMKATLHTNQGDITIEFMDADAPNTVANFVKLAKEGFYNGTKFHRVIDGFMIQGGDPLTKDDTMQARWGTGDPGYKFADEIHANNKNMTGTIAMANSGPNTNGSQFFINVADNNFLDTKHTVFGRVTAGMDVVTKIEKTETNAQDRPVQPIVINSVSLE